MKIDKPEIRLAMLGMIPGNGHPYSWSAIVNGYRPDKMADCPYPVIPVYLGKQPLASIRIPGARVTHIWTDDPADAVKVAEASKIEHIVSRPEEVIGKVDAVIIGTDDGHDHVRRAAPFIAAGLPLFVDKPLAINIDDLNQFIRWQRAGHPILSSSGMRYAPELAEIRRRKAELGEIRWIASCTSKTWERYGIHALEALYPVVGPGFLGVRAETQPDSCIAYVTHRSGVQITLTAIVDALGSYGALHLFGTKGNMPLNLQDTYTAFRNQLLAFLGMLRSGARPYPLSETIELMAVIMAGIRSREGNGRFVKLDEIYAEIEM